jgi:hypothetical protein
MKAGGVWKNEEFICKDYGVWGVRVPSAEFGGWGVGRVKPPYLTYPMGRDTI